MKYSPKLIEENVNVTPTHPLKEFFLLLGALIGILVVVYFSLGAAVEWAIGSLTWEMEKKLSSTLLPSLEFLLDSTEDSESLKKITDELSQQISENPFSYQVILSDSSEFNAIALPGGNIVVFRGLYEKTKSENEIAFVLGHELGHFYHRDHLRGLGRGLVLWFLTATLFGGDSSISSLSSDLLLNVERKHSQSQETAADLFAADLLFKRYGHTEGAFQFMQNMIDQEEEESFFPYFSTHPQPKKRLEALEEHIREQGYPTTP